MSASNVQSVTVGSSTRLVRTWERPDHPWAALLLVHGIAEHSGRYERVGSQLSDAGVKVRSFDLPGFGGSGGLRAYVGRFSHYLDAVGEELAEVAEPGLPLVLLGHSLGGLIALNYALDRDLKPDFLILSAPAIDAQVPAWQRMLAPLLSKILPKLSFPSFIEGHQLSRDPAVGEAYFADPLVHTKSTARLGAESFSAMAQAVGRTPEMPTHVVHGGADTIVPPEVSAELGLSASRKLYPSLRHELFNEPEGPDVVADVIAWLRSELA